MRRYEVDVPIHHATDQERRGLHVFTGYAAGPDEALAAAHHAYDRAVQHMSAGRPAPTTPATDGLHTACVPTGSWTGTRPPPRRGSTPTA
ncbi:hypothetical protein NKH18_00350 [Streptomyces sp. M10(2022)]